MSSSRRDFLKHMTLTFGAITLPSWVLEAEAAAGELLAAEKHRLADAAPAEARRAGTTYADIRINRYRSESITTRERQVQNVARAQSFGFGVRALVRGTWGFASSPALTEPEVRRVARQAAEIARADARYQRRPVQLAPAPKVSGYVEDGRVRHAARNLRFNQSIVRMLAPGNVELVSAPERVSSSEGQNPALLPALKLKAFTFTSQSEAI